MLLNERDKFLAKFQETPEKILKFSFNGSVVDLLVEIQSNSLPFKLSASLSTPKSASYFPLPKPLIDNLPTYFLIRN